MRSTIIAALTSTLLLAACGDDAGEPVGFDPDVPEFADDGGVERGDVAERPAQALSATLALDGEAIDLTDGTCVATEVDVPGGFGFQAALAERDGSVSATVEPSSGDAEIELFVDGELVPTSGATAAAEDGVWQIRTGGRVGGTEGSTEEGNMGPATGEDGDSDGPDTGDTAADDVGPEGLVEVREVLLTFECPTEFEERMRGTTGVGDATGDPGQVDG